MSSRPSDFPLTRPGPFRLFRTVELLKLPPPDWLIEGVLPAGSLTVLFGSPAHGKSFVAIDMAMAVATGTPWQGRPTIRGTAIYVSAEGGPGIGKRVQAWLQHRQIGASVPSVAWLTEAITLNPEYDNTDVDVLMERIDKELMAVPSVVIFDTLARCYEGDENLQKDMNRFVATVDRFRHQYGCAVVVVHHTGLVNDRERGSTNLRGAADTMIRCTKETEGLITVSCVKQKDDEPFPPFVLEMRTVDVGRDYKDRPVTSCVLIGRQSASPEELAHMILAALNTAQTPLFPKDLLEVTGVPRRTLFRELKRLVALRKIINESGHYSLKPTRQSATQKRLGTHVK